jgi:hypothetical protein
VSTLAFNHEQIVPRQLKPELLELDGISRETVEAHYRLQGAGAHAKSRLLAKPL